MTVFNNIYSVPLHLRRAGETSRPVINLETESAVAESYYNGYTYEEAFRTELRVSSDWYANQAEYHDRERHARNDIIHTLYEPVLSKLRYIVSAAYDRDFRYVLELCSEIEKELLGDVR